MIDQKFVILGAILNLLGSSSYVVDTLSGRAQPNRVTWFLWALAPLIAFFAEIGQGVGLPALMTFMVGAGPLAVFIASFVNRKAFWRATRIDVVCGAMSLLALALWAITRIGNVAIAFSILSDMLAGAPTLIKVLKAPETENYKFFLLYAASAAVTLLTVKTWTFANYGFPAFTLMICLMYFVIIKFRLGRAAHCAI